ncbi:MAG: hypothetical protein EBT27_07590 [Betaproteobacteria bacterium]|nr:hypothetical protein [Betaproteobacteria bacterium]
MSTTPGSQQAEETLALLGSIRRAPGQVGDYAPHKPLMLLLALARVQQGKNRLASFREVEPELKGLLQEFARSDAEKTRHLPYWRLKNDHAGRLWEVRDSAGQMHTSAVDPPALTVLRTSDVGAGFSPHIYDALRGDRQLVVKAAREILDANFPASLHADIAEAVGLDLQDATESVSAGQHIDAAISSRRPRNPAFRQEVLRAYEYRCCVCGFDLRVGHMPAGLEAAHIQWHNIGGPDEVSNGLALCSLHHKLFDLGAFTVEHADLRVVFSQHAIAGNRGLDGELRHHGRPLLAPQQRNMRPGESYLAWNHRNVFKAPARTIET